MSMKFLATILMCVGLAACATVDGARTDLGNGITKVGDWVKPGAKQ